MIFWGLSSNYYLIGNVDPDNAKYKKITDPKTGMKYLATKSILTEFEDKILSQNVVLPKLTFSFWSIL